MSSSSAHGHKHSGSVSHNTNSKAQLVSAYNELGRELSSSRIRVVGNYTLGKVIGEGAYGKVRLGTHRLTSTRVAIKQIPKSMSASLTREIHHHRQLHHPHVTQMYEVIATESYIWIVSELCSGGELFDYLAEKNPARLDEDETRVLFGQLCLAVHYLHEKGIVHRDLKLENILLDERCRVKLGDFGFTREYERGTYLETFCGTTGYASPEMLMGKKYMGPEVDIWSMGIILYCLLTGTLPFDHDDESVMRNMIIQGDFEDPEWLSAESRDLIKNILVKDPSKRFTIPKILAHPWFTARSTNVSSASLPLVAENEDEGQPLSMSPSLASPLLLPYPLDAPLSARSSTTSDSTFLSASSRFPSTASAPTTPDEQSSQCLDPFDSVLVEEAQDYPMIHRNPSDSTIRKLAARSSTSNSKHPETVLEEEDATPSRPPLTTMNSSTTVHSSSKVPPAHPSRTPLRTKRRSVSSNLSEPSDPLSPVTDKPLTPLPPQDFSSLINTPAPMIFSTPLERKLLNSLSVLGFDTGQIVHSVLSDACDAAGAVWWITKRKAEKRALEETQTISITDAITDELDEKKKKKQRQKSSDKLEGKDWSGRKLVTVGVQTEMATLLSLAKSAPELAFVPPTPTVPSAGGTSITPPRTTSPIHMGRLSPSMSSSPSGPEFTRSHPSTPVSSLRDKEGGSKGRRDGKNRSGSVSIMQRATTALEAAGLVRKKSSEAVREHQEKDRERDREKEKEKSKEGEKKAMSGEEPRSSHGSGSSKLTKSPPMRAVRDAPGPATPTSEDTHHAHPAIGSPWVVTGSKQSPPQVHSPTPANSPGDTLASLPNITERTHKNPNNRNRASLLSAFRLWFNEDRKGKRKEPASRASAYRSTLATPNASAKGSMRRNSGSGRFQGTHRGKRGSVSSRRSSSVNSKRSSGASGMFLESPHLVLEQVPPRRSMGAHTPSSERGDFPSRPSSVHSFNMNSRHRKSPSASSAGSAHFRAASPSKHYHQRAGSGSSTRVVRQVQVPRPVHHRSNSATSSIHSLASSRPTSFYEDSEAGRGVSPCKRPREDSTPRRGSGSTTFIAQKKSTPFTSPGNLNSVGRSTWKKSWGLEPPGWQTRATTIPIEILAVSPAGDSPTGQFRDVFSGRGSLSLGDEDDWVDEDDDLPGFAGGLGQLPTSASSSTFGTSMQDPPLTLSPPPRGSNRSGRKRANNRGLGLAPSSIGSASGGKSSPIPAEPSPGPNDNRAGAGRRQLPPGRSGPAFRHPIVEEDEGEEEE